MKTVSIFLGLAFVFVTALYCSAQDYVVGEGDLLRITVYDNPDLTTSARIGGEGTILFPLLGQVKVAGLSVPQVAKELEDRLADGYIISPQVTVAIEEFRSQKATIIGQVNKPGLYELRGDTTFLQMLSNAGDLTKEAGDKAVIKRGGANGKQEKVITIDLNRLIKMGDMSLNIPIEGGDSIYIAKAGLVYVSGQAKKPDAYKYEEGMTVLKAITLAGGFTEWAAKGSIKIIRVTDGQKQTLEKVKMDTPILPADVIVISTSWF